MVSQKSVAIYSSGYHASYEKLEQKNSKWSEKYWKPSQVHSLQSIASTTPPSLIEKAFIKKPVLNLTLALTLVFRVKHDDVFHC